MLLAKTVSINSVSLSKTVPANSLLFAKTGMCNSEVKTDSDKDSKSKM